MSFLTIRKILEDRSQGQRPLARQVTAALVVEKANQILENYFPKLIPDYLNIICFKNSVLLVGVASPAVAAEIRLKKKQILNELEQALGTRIVLDIKFAPLQPIF
ncbi:MAG: DciA family protein [Candidatus Magasanikbacteria bacterium]|nr:DciA family protein [Candidatus Magasanikbacteria bacterium]